MKKRNASVKSQVSQDEIARYWTLSDKDKVELMQYRKDWGSMRKPQIFLNLATNTWYY
jgi:hypothetical protein